MVFQLGASTLFRRMTFETFEPILEKGGYNMWRILLIASIVPGAVLGQTGVAAFASPLYELVTFGGEPAHLNRRPILTFKITGTTYDTDRIYVCVQEQKKTWGLVLYRFQARDIGGPFLTSELYELVERRSVALSPTSAAKLASLLKDLATPEGMRSGVNEDAKRFVTISYLIAGGVEYPESQISRYMPLFDSLCASLQRGDDQAVVEETIEAFFRTNRERKDGDLQSNRGKRQPIE